MICSDQSLTACCTGLYELPLTALLLGDSFHPGGIALSKRLAEMVVLGPGDRVLDVACGAGSTAHVLATEYGAEVYGIDRSLQLIERAKQQPPSPDCHITPQFYQADVSQLPFESASLDCVFCECALCTFVDPMAALQEFHRVLKPTGRLAISDITIERPIPSALQNILAHSLCIAGAHSVTQYQTMIAEAGFSTIRVQPTDRVLSDMIDRIEARLQLSEVVLALQDTQYTDESINAGQTLTEARKFITSGGAGYALFTARR